MTLKIGKELAAMRRMTGRELRQKYEAVFGEVCRSNHKEWLIKRIAWRIQANEEGDLSERARRRAEELAHDADLRLKPPVRRKPSPPAVRAGSAPAVSSHDPRIPLPGSRLTRHYKGELLQVTVLDAGFEYEGENFRTLSAVAKAITGSHTNGYLFFRLNGKGARR
jgi:hypothetical protein